MHAVDYPRRKAWLEAAARAEANGNREAADRIRNVAVQYPEGT